MRELPQLTFGEAISVGFKHAFTVSGRARRSEYWWFSIFLGILYMFISILAVLAWPIAIIFGILYVIIYYNLTIRRLHDTNHSGWWLGGSILLILLALGTFVTQITPLMVLGGLFYLVAAGLNMATFVFTLMDSDKGENRYGPSPKYIEDSSTVSNNMRNPNDSAIVEQYSYSNNPMQMSNMNPEFSVNHNPNYSSNNPSYSNSNQSFNPNYTPNQPFGTPNNPNYMGQNQGNPGYNNSNQNFGGKVNLTKPNPNGQNINNPGYNGPDQNYNNSAFGNPNQSFGDQNYNGQNYNNFGYNDPNQNFDGQNYNGQNYNNSGFNNPNQNFNGQNYNGQNYNNSGFNNPNQYFGGQN